jgi:predicted nucleic acid-binding protein
MIVIDTNTFSLIFNSQNVGHEEFRPVFQWIKSEREACMVYGGTKYREELKKASQYLRLFNEWKKIGKFVEINRQLIDQYENHLGGINNDRDFDDRHIVAIINISGCKLICTMDSRSMPYLKNRTFYVDGKIPKIYSGSRNKDLLNKKNIVTLRNVVK